MSHDNTSSPSLRRSFRRSLAEVCDSISKTPWAWCSVAACRPSFSSLASLFCVPLTLSAPKHLKPPKVVLLVMTHQISPNENDGENKFAWNIKTFVGVTAPVSLLPQNFLEPLFAFFTFFSGRQRGCCVFGPHFVLGIWWRLLRLFHQQFNVRFQTVSWAAHTFSYLFSSSINISSFLWINSSNLKWLDKMHSRKSFFKNSFS